MGKTPIEWTAGGSTWNPIRARNVETGGVGHYCEKVSPGCANCYAATMQKRFRNHIRYNAADRGKVELFLDEEVLTYPLRWRKPQNIFPCSMTDIFGGFVPDEWIERIFDVMFEAKRHTFQLLTKRAGRLYDFVSRSAFLSNAPLENLWLGVSVENQREADERIPYLLQTPAAVRWVSAEPLLGAVDLEVALPCRRCKGRGWYLERFSDNHGTPCRYCIDMAQKHGTYVRERQFVKRGDSYIHWVVAGGESGSGARPMHPDWARSIRNQCVAAGVPFFFKQWGRHAPALDWNKRVEDLVPVYLDGAAEVKGHEHEKPTMMRRFGDKKAAGRRLDGRTWDEFPTASPAAAQD
jgi:protein gp37